MIRRRIVRWLLDDDAKVRRDEIVFPVEDVGSARPADAIYREIAMQRLTAQLQQADLVDTKASALFTIGSTVLPITAGLLSTDPIRIRDNWVSLIALCAGFVSYVLLAIQFGRCWMYGRWDARPDLEQLREITIGRTEDDVNRWIGDACVEAYLSNRPYLTGKSRQLSWALTWLGLEAAFLAVAVLAPLF
jgi:hypothetical protein